MSQTGNFSMPDKSEYGNQRIWDVIHVHFDDFKTIKNVSKKCIKLFFWVSTKAEDTRIEDCPPCRAASFGNGEPRLLRLQTDLTSSQLMGEGRNPVKHCPRDHTSWIRKPRPEGFFSECFPYQPRKRHFKQFSLKMWTFLS